MGLFKKKAERELERKRNEPCPCGSKLKYKLCHGDEAKVQTAQHMAEKILLQLIGQEQIRHNICPRCTGKLAPDASSGTMKKCQECGLDIISSEEAARRQQQQQLLVPDKRLIIPN